MNQKKRLRDLDANKQPCDSDVTRPLMPLNLGSTVPATQHGNAQHSGPCNRQVPLNQYSDTLNTPAPKTPMVSSNLSLRNTGPEFSLHSGPRIPTLGHSQHQKVREIDFQARWFHWVEVKSNQTSWDPENYRQWGHWEPRTSSRRKTLSWLWAEPGEQWHGTWRESRSQQGERLN